MEERKLTDNGIKKRIKDLSGEKFGMLTILKFSHTKNNRSYWLCYCDCGKNKIVSANNLKYGTTKVCGCLKNKRYDETAEFGKCTIDRINVNGNYEPSNCRWVSMKEQLNNYSRNVLITANGITLNVQQWAKKLGVNNATLRSRLKRGWTDEKIINTPLQKRPWR